MILVDSKHSVLFNDFFVFLLKTKLINLSSPLPINNKCEIVYPLCTYFSCLYFNPIWDSFHFLWSRLPINNLHANLTLPLPNQSSLWKLQKSLWKHIPWMEFIINPFYDYFWYGEALRLFTIRKSTNFFTIGIVYVKMSITPFNVYLCSNFFL